jgi:hypothetical protein
MVSAMVTMRTLASSIKKLSMPTLPRWLPIRMTTIGGPASAL